MNVNYLHKTMLLLLLFLAPSWRVSAKTPAPVESSGITVFDVWKYFESEKITDVQYQADILYFLSSLQGLANRDGPHLYLLATLSLMDLESRYLGTPNEKTAPITDLDRFWLEWMQRQGLVQTETIVQAETLEEVIARYQPEIRGLVQWDCSVGATLNAAFMAAGAESLLPVSDRLASGTLRNWLGEKFPALQIKLNLSGVFQGGSNTVSLDGIEFRSCGSAKNDVYRFAIERFIKSEKLSPEWMWYNCDGYVWSAPDRWNAAAYSRELYGRAGTRAQFQHNGLYNADFWVSKRAVFLDLYPWDDSTPSDDPDQRLGEDFKTWNDILEWSYKQRNGKFGITGGFMHWWIKYTKLQGNLHDPVPGEHKFIALLSSYNMANDGDAAFGIANASFFQHMPKVARKDCEWTYPPSLKLNPGTTYIAFCMMDYDGSAWLNQAAVSIYRDPARGRIPLNWCINPILNERVPQAFRYMVENRTSLDFFGIETDGAGYISPFFLQPGTRAGRIQTDGLAAYKKFTGLLHQRFNYQYTAFYITSQADTPWMEMCFQINPDGFGAAIPSPPLSVNGNPVIQLKYFSVPKVANGTFLKVMEDVYSRTLEENPQTHFEAWRCILLNPTQITETVDAVEKKYPGAKVKIVDWPNFLQLRKQWLELPPEKR